jgi:hypothetical protein
LRLKGRFVTFEMMVDGVLLAEGKRRLEQTALHSGGWGYHTGGQFFVEPTALALLALAPRNPSSPPPDSPVTEQSMTALLSCQRQEGFFGATIDDPDASWTTSPALLALSANGLSQKAKSAAEWLVRWQIPEKPPSDAERRQVKRLLRIDFTLHGWPWQAGEGFATVEPTSLACIALRAWGNAAAAPRIAEGLRYLADRACPDGGWNYGNPYFFDDALPPVTLPTAKGLLALLLCGEPSATPLVTRSTDTLSRLLERNPSRKAHAWGALVFAALGDGTRALVHARSAVDSGDGRGPWGGGPDVNALAILALRAADGDAPSALMPARA